MFTNDELKQLDQFKVVQTSTGKYRRCVVCNKYIKLDEKFLRSAHVCLTEDEIFNRDNERDNDED